GTLEVSEISSDTPEFFASPVALNVGGIGSADVVVTFAPTIEDTIEGLLTVVCNDPDEGVLYINLRGVAIAGCPGELGDVNGDGAVNILDMVVAVNEILHPGTLALCEKWRADCNQDEVVNILDMVGIVNVILETGTCPPTGTAKSIVFSAQVWAEEEGVERGATPSRWDRDPFGKSVELPIFVDTEGEIRGAQFKLSYDPEVLVPGVPQLTERTAQMTVAFNAWNGELTLVVYSVTVEMIPAGSGPILTIPFKTQDSRPKMHDTYLQFTEVILAAGCTEVIPVEIRPISLKTGSLLPETWGLEQNYPNPFNPTTSIQYSVVSDQSPPHITLKIYNILGQEVRTLVDETTEAGYYTVTWDGRDDRGLDVTSGVYFYHLKAGQFSQIKKMLLLR
ncbi:MAG: FlgD immunoglobulin-like domain containing protein, partial [bacterium]